MLLHAHNAVHWFINDFTSRIIAETGIPSDRFHLGKLIYWGMKEDPTFVSQVIFLIYRRVHHLLFS